MSNGVLDFEEGLYPPELPLPNSEEIEILTKHFVSKFGTEPDFYVRAPGRVNLIGEHVDYCGYSVCPMAIQQHILVAFKRTDDMVVKLSNTDHNYEDIELSLNDIRSYIQEGWFHPKWMESAFTLLKNYQSLSRKTIMEKDKGWITKMIPKCRPRQKFGIPTDEIPKWYRYFLCAIKGVLEKIELKDAPGGIMAVVSGSILPNSGLSSSSALVCAATLAVSKGFGLTLTKKELAELATKSEKYIGTQGGGMDQAIAFLATEGCAKVISFNPLTATELKLPEGAVFVIASSLVQMNKAATQDFNRRVVECRLVSQLLSKRLRIDWKKIHRLDSMQKSIGLGVRHLRALATETLHEEPYKKDEICRELQITQDELDNISLTENTKHIKEFKLKQRMLHVTQEVERVQEFIRVCKECAKGDMSPEAALYNLGLLMKKSHESLKTLYECSHEELDKIVAIAEKHTLGARVTGAGWGGCTVALTTADKVDDYISALKEEFYADNPRADDLDLNTLVFQTQPGRGAVIYIKA